MFGLKSTKMRQKVTLTRSNCFGDWGDHVENVNRQKRAFQGEAENWRSRIIANKLKINLKQFDKRTVKMGANVPGFWPLQQG